VGIIPARYGSARFPGKPLAELLGKPMFWHVYQRAMKCALIHEVLLATDDERIYTKAADLEVPVVMTSDRHHSGTDRIMEAAAGMGLHQDDIVLNIQGDEPALEPEMLEQLLGPLISSPEIKMTTLARTIDYKSAQSPHVVKVVRSQSGRALYFSRSLIPYSEKKNEEFLVHIGLYAYRFRCLEKFCRLGQSVLERKEKLEQLRLLEADIPINVVLTRHTSQGVDVPEDISKVVQILQERQQ